MFITRVDFRAFDRNHTEWFVTEAPIMEKALTARIKRNHVDTALLQKVVRYEAIDLKHQQTDEYDMYGKRVTPDLNEKSEG